MITEKIQQVIQGISSLDNNSFYEALCLSLSETIGATFVFIASIDKKKTSATTIALSANNKIIKNISYSLNHTPCADVSCGKISTYHENVQHNFPKDKLLVDMNVEGYIGIPLYNIDNEVYSILVALYQKPIVEQVNDIVSFFLLFTGLIQKELEKDAYIDRLTLSNNIIEKSHEAILVCDSENKIIYSNKALENITGYTAEEMLAQPPALFRSDVHDNNYFRKMWHDIKEKGNWSGEITNKHKAGFLKEHFLSINAIKNNDNSINYVAFIRDITEKKQAEKKINFHANHDALTKLTNRFFFTEQLSGAIKASFSQKYNRRPLCVIYFDLDNFNEINNTYGLSFGDKVLTNMTKRLRPILHNKFFSRLDGDGFAILFDYLNKEEIPNLIKVINIAMQTPLLIDGVHINISFCYGVSCFKQSESLFSADEYLNIAKSVLIHAEQAMLNAKKVAPNTCLYFSQEMEDKVRYKKQLKDDLIRAIELELISVDFQPIISLKNNRISKFESLVRWNNNGQWISPVEFIPLAEENGLIVPLGEIVLKKTCQQIQQLLNQGITDITFNVNRSIYEFSPASNGRNPWLACIKNQGIPPKYISFELTESVLAPENSHNLLTLKQLQSMGCKIALDDFGTGYSSLSYLRRFPVDYLKIDRSFIIEICENKEDKVLVQSIISMSKTLGILVVAEGVETKEQLDILIALDCDFIQGYYFSKPLKSDELISFLNNFSIDSNHINAEEKT